MKRQVLAFLMASLALVTTAPAANYAWLGTGTTPDWTDGGNWWDLDNAGTGTAPAAGDLAVLNYPNPAFSGLPRPVMNSVPYTDTAHLSYLGMDWYDESVPDIVEGNPILTVGAGGLLEVDYTWMNVSGQETATINLIDGGVLRSWVQLQMGMTAGGTSQINIDSGFLYTPSLVFGPGTSNIDLELAGSLYLAGDVTTQVATWIDEGKITGGGGALEVQSVYGTPLAGLTTVYAVVPESATFTAALLGLGVVLRRRKS